MSEALQRWMLFAPRPEAPTLPAKAVSDSSIGALALRHPVSSPLNQFQNAGFLDHQCSVSTTVQLCGFFATADMHQVACDDYRAHFTWAYA